jgi:hypothetical protein
MFKNHVTIFLVVVCITQQLRGQSADTRLAAQGLQLLTDVMIDDITSPLVASRDYTYAMIAYYEGARNSDTHYRSYAGQLNGLSAGPQPVKGMAYDWLTAGTAAFYKTARAFVFSKDKFDQGWAAIAAASAKRKIPSAMRARSEAYGASVADWILAWSKEDNYSHIRTLPRFTPTPGPGTWQPTPPDYMEAIEPYWNQLRPMVLKSPGEVPIPLPAPFKSAQFLAECREVDSVHRHLTPDQEWAANFWDCNPFATRTVGHLMYSIKKVSPGGHWMGIAAIAAKMKNQPLVQALATYSIVSVALYDAFIACWDVKYKTNCIRPVTSIQQLMDPSWEALLQTPPFPEYPSGHSVISMASAVVLSSIYGDHFAFTDNSEKPYGVKSRSYSSFSDAAREAAISRLYGGIHFREAIEYGTVMGKTIGELVTERVSLHTN